MPKSNGRPQNRKPKGEYRIHCGFDATTTYPYLASGKVRPGLRLISRKQGANA